MIQPPFCDQPDSFGVLAVLALPNALVKLCIGLLAASSLGSVLNTIIRSNDPDAALLLSPFVNLGWLCLVLEGLALSSGPYRPNSGRNGATQDVYCLNSMKEEMFENSIVLLRVVLWVLVQRG